jgi:vesicle transport protein SEC22
VQYLSELCTEFDLQNGSQVSGATRPYAFVKFDTFIQKTSKLYADSRAPRNTAKLAQDLAEVRAVVTRSVADVLGAGERLESVSAASANLRSETQRYAKKAHMLSRQALIRQWMPLIAVGGVVIALLLMRWLARRLFGR